MTQRNTIYLLLVPFLFIISGCTLVQDELKAGVMEVPADLAPGQVVPVRMKLSSTVDPLMAIVSGGLEVTLSDDRYCRDFSQGSAVWEAGDYPGEFGGDCEGITFILTVITAEPVFGAFILPALAKAVLEYSAVITMPDGKSYELVSR